MQAANEASNKHICYTGSDVEMNVAVSRTSEFFTGDVRWYEYSPSKKEMTHHLVISLQKWNS